MTTIEIRVHKDEMMAPRIQQAMFEILEDTLGMESYEVDDELPEFPIRARFNERVFAEETLKLCIMATETLDGTILPKMEGDEVTWESCDRCGKPVLDQQRTDGCVCGEGVSHNARPDLPPHY